MRINKEYCVTCGGLRSYVEDNPTAAAPTGWPGTRTQVFPSNIPVTAGAPTTNDFERICGCRSQHKSD